MSDESHRTHFDESAVKVPVVKGKNGGFTISGGLAIRIGLALLIAASLGIRDGLPVILRTFGVAPPPKSAVVEWQDEVARVHQKQIDVLERIADGLDDIDDSLEGHRRAVE